MKKRRGKSTPRTKLIAKLDRAFSRYIRQKDADHAGYVDCYTCGKTKHWKEVDAGHFQTRAKYSTRWDEENVKPQCKHCNMRNGGHQYEFGLHLDREYGAGKADEVIRRSNDIRKFSNHELEVLAQHYTRLANKYK